MEKKENLAMPTIVLLIICLVAAALLAMTYQVTAPQIAKIQAEQAAEARKAVLADADTFEKIDATMIEGVTEIYKASNGVGVVITASFKGFGGPVVVMTGIDATGAVTGVKVTQASDETPGLGSKATLPSHVDKFMGATAIKNGDGDGTQIDGVTGATYTSNAVFNAVSASLAQFAELGGAF